MGFEGKGLKFRTCVYISSHLQAAYYEGPRCLGVYKCRECESQSVALH